MAKTVYSDNQNNVDALAERLSSQTSLSDERAKLVAYDLLCRKEQDQVERAGADFPFRR